MNKIIKIASLFLFVGSLFTFTACKNDDPRVFEPSLDTNSNIEEYTEQSIIPVNPGEDLRLELSGDLESFKSTDEIENETRSFHIDNQEYNINGYPLIYKKSIEENWGIFYFKKIGSTTITKRALPYTIQPLDEDGNEVDEGRRAKIKITVRPATAKDNPKVNAINLDNGETFADGEWYISGLLGTGEALKNGVLVDQKFTSYSLDAPAGLNNAIEWDASSADAKYRQLNMPIRLMWSKLKGTTDNVAGRTIGGAFAKDLKFAVTGALVSLRTRSNVFDDVYVSGVYIKSWNMSFNGVFSENLSGITDDVIKKGNSIPYQYTARDQVTWDRTTAQNWLVLNANFFSRSGNDTKYSFRIPGGGSANSQLKLIVMPIVPPTKEYHRRNQTHVAWVVSRNSDKSNTARSTMQTLRIKNGTNPNPLRSEDGTELDANAIHEGRYYNFNVDIETDLMITEVFSHNPAGNNYGWIELYNGTMETIDLSNYALGRSIYRDNPIDNNGKGKAYIPIPTNVTAYGSSLGQGFGQGAIMPLTMETTAPLKGRNLEYNRNLFDNSIMKQKWVGADDIMTSMNIAPQTHKDLYWGREKVYFGTLPNRVADKYEGESYTYQHKTPEQMRLLPPGKTIILLMNGYFRDVRWGTAVTPAVTWNVNTSTGTDGYLHGPQMFRAYKAGYLHEIIVSFSAANKVYNATNYYGRAQDEESPILHKGDRQGVYLVRLLPSGYKRIIDAFGPLDSNTSKSDAFYNWQSSKKRIYVRKDHILFPDFSAGTEQWDMSDYSSGYQYSYPITELVWTSAGTRYKHEKIRPNYPDKYDGTDRYTPKQRTW